jgi:hypothetical protein
MALLFPIFVFFILGFAKIFALLVVVQKVELAAYYAARRWQLESHRNIAYEGTFDNRVLIKDIKNKVCGIVGCSESCGTRRTSEFLGIRCRGVKVTVNRAQVWNVVEVKVPIRSWRLLGKTVIKQVDFKITKFVPNRDRPISFNLPGLAAG